MKPPDCISRRPRLLNGNLHYLKGFFRRRNEDWELKHQNTLDIFILLLYRCPAYQNVRGWGTFKAGHSLVELQYTRMVYTSIFKEFILNN